MRFFSMRRTTASDGSGDSTAPPLQAASGSNVKPVPARALALVSDPTKAWDIVRAVQGEPEILVDVEHRKAQDLYTDVAPPKREGTVRFVAVSDTHSTESRKSTGPTAFEAIPEGDVLLHCGDFTNIGRLEEIEAFAKWFGSLPHQRKIIIAGNHDLSLHEESYESTAARFGGEGRHRKLDAADVCSRARAILESIPNCEYLCDSGTSVEGIRVWGSPWQPEFCEWAFNLPRGEPCRAKWKLIPTGTEVVLTHGPPLGHGDLCMPARHRAGCTDLLDELQSRVKPLYHCFGHIHEGWGVTTDGVTRYVNASTCNLRYKPVNTPIIFDVAVPPAPADQASAPPAEAPASTEAPAAAPVPEPVS